MSFDTTYYLVAFFVYGSFSLLLIYFLYIMCRQALKALYKKKNINEYLIKTVSTIVNCLYRYLYRPLMYLHIIMAIFIIGGRILPLVGVPLFIQYLFNYLSLKIILPKNKETNSIIRNPFKQYYVMHQLILKDRKRAKRTFIQFTISFILVFPILSFMSPIIAAVFILLWPTLIILQMIKLYSKELTKLKTLFIIFTLNILGSIELYRTVRKAVN